VTWINPGKLLPIQPWGSSAPAGRNCVLRTWTIASVDFFRVEEHDRSRTASTTQFRNRDVQPISTASTWRHPATPTVAASESPLSPSVDCETARRYRDLCEAFNMQLGFDDYFLR
jgi:hypothetical protein